MAQYRRGVLSLLALAVQVRAVHTTTRVCGTPRRMA